MTTPASSVLLNNIENFVMKWQAAEHEDCKILTDKVMGQIDALKSHVRRDCLSNIECCGGTNLNEALHCTINPHFKHVGRIGLPLAFALLSILFYNYNIRRMPKDDIMSKDITCLASSNLSVLSSRFGIIQKEENAFQTVITSNIDAMIDCDENLTFQVEEGISTTKVEQIIKNSLCSAAIANNLQKLSGKSPIFSQYMMPFMSEVPYLYFHSLNNNTSEVIAQHNKRLTNVLKGWDVSKHPMKGDGNCCFNAVAFSIINNFENLTVTQRHFLKTNGIHGSADTESLSIVLRQLVVAEWKENVAVYQDFAPNVDINQEADKFLASGFYYGDLADTMILALANVLQATIVVFSSIECQPVFCITPKVQTISVPFMVAFTQCGSGHYDGVSISTESDISLQDACKYSSGKNDKSNKEHCIQINSKYTSIIKCKCLKNNKGCSYLRIVTTPMKKGRAVKHHHGKGPNMIGKNTHKSIVINML